MDAIRFLEGLGSSSEQLSVAQYEAAVAALEADSAQKQALLARDSAALNRLLGGRMEAMMLGQWAPDSVPQRKDDDQEEGDVPSEDPTPDSEQAS